MSKLLILAGIEAVRFEIHRRLFSSTIFVVGMKINVASQSSGNTVKRRLSAGSDEEIKDKINNIYLSNSKLLIFCNHVTFRDIDNNLF